jgi:hypothetical protein
MLQEIESRDEIPEGYHLIETMGKTGDKKEIWNPRIPEEVESAEDTFDSLREKGYLAFTVNEDGSQGDQITEFDPKAGKMLMVPQMVGG